MEKIINDADRLLNIITAVRNFKSNLQLSKAWSEIFNFEESNREKILTSQVKIFRIAERIKLQLKTINTLSRREIYDSYISEISNLIFPLTFVHSVDSYKNNINDTHLERLHILSDILNSHNVNEKETSEEEIILYIERIDEIYEELENSTLNSDAKKILLRCLDSISNAFFDYKTDGSEAFKQALEKIYGTILLERNNINANEAKEEEKNIFRKLLNLIKDVNALYTLSTMTTKALENSQEIVKVLLP